jgi:hypothetical protein
MLLFIYIIVIGTYPFDNNIVSPLLDTIELNCTTRRQRRTTTAIIVRWETPHQISIKAHAHLSRAEDLIHLRVDKPHHIPHRPTPINLIARYGRRKNRWNFQILRHFR